ncbi:MAG TPA: hypothetical protein VFT17_11200 [Propionibacteriaceae bacterium]|nr:hypothetical protein [Propionibacteriaceae bacterium]
MTQPALALQPKQPSQLGIGGDFAAWDDGLSEVFMTTSLGCREAPEERGESAECDLAPEQGGEAGEHRSVPVDYSPVAGEHLRHVGD